MHTNMRRPHVIMSLVLLEIFILLDELIPRLIVTRELYSREILSNESSGKM